MRYLVFFSVFAFATGAGAIFACSYGNYDGSGPAADAGGEAGTLVLEKTVDPNKEEKLQTPDTAFELTIAAGTFDGPAKITISRLANRLIDQRLNVPVYTVTSDKETGLPVEVKFNGSDNSQDPGRILVPAIAQADGTFRPTPMVGLSGSQAGPTATFWGLTRRLGTFSLVYESYSQQGNAFNDVTSGSCLTQCCNAMTGGGLNAGSLGTSCLCNGGPNLQCFLGACQPNVASAIERCVEVANSSRAPVLCTPSAGCPSGGPCNIPNTPCTNGSACCIASKSWQCTGTGTGAACPGIAIRCDRGTKCPDGTQCCVFDNEAYCSSTCSTERTWCNTQSDCDGGATADAGPDASANAEGPCFAAPNCPHGTCGTPPTACK